LLVLLAAIVSCGAARVAWQFTPWGQLPYLRARTGIDLPTFPSNLFVYDDAEMSITVHAVLPADLVAKVLQTAPFQVGDTDPVARPSQPSDLFRAEELSEAYRHLPHGARIRHGRGCGNGTSWVALLDDVSGAIWIEVMHPDMSGDEPPCP
jgi:hypothetical protein